MRHKEVGHDIIVVGASAGGVQALCKLMEGLPAGLPASVFVVLHIAPHGYSALPAILSRTGCLPASHPVDGERIEPGRIYVAPPDRHLALDDGRIQLSRNASENGHRPAVDVLFRTAARAFGSRVVGVVLTGNLDDGTAGLAIIKLCGGVAVVQDPREADYPSMPESAIANVEVDYVLPIAEIPVLLGRLLREPRHPEPPADCGHGSEGEPDSMGVSSEQDHGNKELAGKPSGLTCPDCGGSLWEKKDDQPIHFRCRTGHAYSPESLLAKQSESRQAALWAGLRSLEENAALARRMGERAAESGNLASRQRYEQQAREASTHATQLRSILQQGRTEEGMETKDH